ncbi:sensor histidine kinase [Streptomyces cylindrosporus]|uniref:Histidine kinase n=1 Tax=Streptomyces cylindrosporus TaxID=2927583 RepID=A0ABS9YMW3_9ACTN|nr:histidine kinase [Streptomyces cylindrosporus]MCI3278601.1 histidine kinase [Streptomyces cylindrosporus]
MIVAVYGDWVLDSDVPLWARVPVVPAVGLQVVASVVLLGGALAERQRRPSAVWLSLAVAASLVLAVFPLVRHNYGLWAVGPAVTVAIGASFLSPRPRTALIICAVILALVPGGAVSLAAGDGQTAYAVLFPAGLVAFTVWTVLGPLWAWRIAGRLDRARLLEAEVAVKDERLRFASDLHDIQGHHLQVIAMKAELASRRTATDPAGAAAEMQEIRQLCSDALRDTRAVVRGIRRTTLDEELANSARVLAAAGVDARTHLEPGVRDLELSESARTLLGLVVREATTNVLRHSHAGSVEVDHRVSDGRLRLRITNDGADSALGPSDGTGLNGLADRFRATGGELTWARVAGGRFEVIAVLPAGTTTEGPGTPPGFAGPPG